MNFYHLSHPNQVTIVSSRQKKDNLITVAWHCPLAHSPKLYGVSIGHQRFSHDQIRKSKKFCVNFLDPELAEIAKKVGSCSGKDTDKFKEFDLEKEECSEIDCPRMKEAQAFLECRVEKETKAGDHTFFTGKVVKSGGEMGDRVFQIGSEVRGI